MKQVPEKARGAGSGAGAEGLALDKAGKLPPWESGGSGERPGAHSGILLPLGAYLIILSRASLPLDGGFTTTRQDCFMALPAAIPARGTRHPSKGCLRSE